MCTLFLAKSANIVHQSVSRRGFAVTDADTILRIQFPSAGAHLGRRMHDQIHEKIRVRPFVSITCTDIRINFCEFVPCRIVVVVVHQTAALGRSVVVSHLLDTGTDFLPLEPTFRVPSRTAVRTPRTVLRDIPNRVLTLVSPTRLFVVLTPSPPCVENIFFKLLYLALRFTCVAGGEFLVPGLPK